MKPVCYQCGQDSDDRRYFGGFYFCEKCYEKRLEEAGEHDEVWF